MYLCQFDQNPPIGLEERMQTRRYADADKIRTKSNMSTPPPTSPLVEEGDRYNLALIDSVVSEMFEECGQRQ